jgi:hypothetical protein
MLTQHMGKILFHEKLVKVTIHIYEVKAVLLLNGGILERVCYKTDFVLLEVPKRKSILFKHEKMSDFVLHIFYHSAIH